MISSSLGRIFKGRCRHQVKRIMQGRKKSSTRTNDFRRRSATTGYLTTGDHSSSVQKECHVTIEDLRLKELDHSTFLVDTPNPADYKVPYAQDIEEKSVHTGVSRLKSGRDQDLNEKIHNEMKYAMQNAIKTFKEDINEVVEEIVAAKLNKTK